MLTLRSTGTMPQPSRRRRVRNKDNVAAFPPGGGVRLTRPTTTAGQFDLDDDSTLRGVNVVKHLLRQMHRGIGRRQSAVQRRVHDQLFQLIAGHPVVKRRA